MEVANPQPLADGSVGFADFTGSRNNRYSTLEAAVKNHILSPSAHVMVELSHTAL